MYGACDQGQSRTAASRVCDGVCQREDRRLYIIISVDVLT